MATTTQTILAASRDNDLKERISVIVARTGADPAIVYGEKLYALLAQPVDTGGATIASVYEYAQATYQQKQAALIPPGADLGAVTDAHIESALEALTGAHEVTIEE